MAALLLALGTASCSDRELQFEGAFLALADRVDVADLDVSAPLPLSGVVSQVAWVRDGFAGIVVDLERDDGMGGNADGLRLTRWPLPLPAASSSGGADDLPELIGLPIARLSLGAELEGEQVSGFWVRGSELGIVHRVGQRLPEKIQLCYPVSAAHLADTALGAGFPASDMFVARVQRGPTSVEALAIPSGATMTIQLPPVPAGRLEGDFSALTSDLSGTGPEVVLRVDGKELFRNVLGTDGSTTPIGTRTQPHLALERSTDPREVEIEVIDAPGSVAFFEAPIWSRPRSWRDTPNVLLVVVDSLRGDRVGALGGRGELTPNLDRLSLDMVGYKHAWSTSCWTLPAVASILTSTHSTQHQAWLHDSRLGRGVTTIAEAYREAGYRTAAFTGGGFVGPVFGVDRGFHRFDGRGGGIDVVLDRAREFLDDAEGGPWFLFLHTYEVHSPYEPPEEAAESVRRSYPNALRDRRPEPQPFVADALDGEAITQKQFQALSELYDAEVAYTDAALGRFFDDLKAGGLYDDAAICITSDHGEEFGEHNLVGHGDALYVESVHVPLFFKLPGNERGGVRREEPASTLDVAPTLMQISELEGIAAGTTFAGRSLFTGKRGSPVYAQRNHPEAGLLEMVRDGNLVYIEGRQIYPTLRKAKGRELFDLDRDRKQNDNRANKNNIKSVNQMRKRLELLRRNFGEVMVEDTKAAIDAKQASALKRLGY